MERTSRNTEIVVVVLLFTWVVLAPIGALMWMAGVQ